ncbi:MAG TPA: hypothetical protein VK749_16745 [Xanthobacteraceae bacterium]|nr:hypothetical protein [Xanthobacteraceae bacterium]
METGIKVIDVMCPLVAGGILAIATDIGAGVMVMMEELVRRLSGGCDPLSIFVMMPPQSPERAAADIEGHSTAAKFSQPGRLNEHRRTASR